MSKENKKIKDKTSEQKIQLLRIASLLALVGNLGLCIAKLLVGFMTPSLSVLGDGIDSAGDVAVSMMFLFVSFIISRPSDKKYPWGRQRAESIASLILSLIIIFAGIQLFIVSIKTLVSFYRGKLVFSGAELIAIVVTALSIVVKSCLALYHYMMAKKTNSFMLKASAKNMLNDVILSASVLLGLALSAVFSSALFDPLLALFASVWILKSGLSIFIEVNLELMDGNSDNDLYKQLFSAVNSVDGVHNPHRVRIRKMGNLFAIDLDIEVDANMTVYDAHLLAEEVTTAIKKNIDNVYDIMVHIEPYGVYNDEEEGFGLRETDI